MCSKEDVPLMEDDQVMELDIHCVNEPRSIVSSLGLLVPVSLLCLQIFLATLQRQEGVIHSIMKIYLIIIFLNIFIFIAPLLLAFDLLVFFNHLSCQYL